jgi:hypothetical protein
MAIGAFSLPRHWEDWLDLALGVWLCASPWVLEFADDMLATQNSFLVGFLLIVTETVVIAAFRPWEEWINVVLGAWLVISPWILNTSPTGTVTTNFVIVGLLVLGLALYEIWDGRRHTAHPA